MLFLKRSAMIAMLTSIAISAFAEEAPVYDVDSFPPQFDGQESVVAPGSKPAMTTPAASPVTQSTSSNFMSSTQSMTTTQRLARLEQQINNMQQSDTTNKVGTMQSDLQALRGQVDELTHQIQELQNQQKKMYSDLDKRVSQNTTSKMTTPASGDIGDIDTNTETPSTVPADTIKPKAKTKPISTTTAIKPINTAQPNSAEEQQIYQTAYGLIKAKKYSAAAKTLQEMLQKYPSGQFAANAHYWLGELYGLMGKNDQAVTEFMTVVNNYPDSPKIADSQLKLGLINAAQFKWTDAKYAFKKVLTNYPGTASARLASEQLKQIKNAGH